MDRLIESRHIAAAHYREITALSAQEQDEPSRWLFLPNTTGGSITLPGRSLGQQGVQLVWQLQNHTTSTLSLAEVSLSSGQVGQGVSLHIPGQLFSALAHYVTGDSCFLFLLLSSKSVGLLQLPLSGTAGAGRHAVRQATGSASILDSLQHRSLLQVQLGQQLGALGIPTAFTAADGHLCIAGSSGIVACLPLPALAAGSTQGMQQLTPSNLISQVRRRMGFAATSSVVAAVPVDLPQQGHQSLLVMHEDSSCHQWFVGQARQGFSQALAGDAAARQLRPNRVLLCPARQHPGEGQARTAPWDALLVWDMGLADSSGQSDVRVMPFRLQAAAAAGSPSRLEPQLQQPQALLLEWPDASLLDARVVGQQLLLLCSAKTGGSFTVSYSCKDWSYQGRCQLLQQRGSADWGMKQELWSAALSVCPEAISPAGHVLSQLLVPGQLCVASLVQALGYHGARTSEQEVAGASLQQLQARISAAVELIKARYPSHSTARCWHSLFSTYCDFWQQQHGPLGLFVSPGGWTGLVRAGGLLTVLRRPSLAEVLQQESSPAALGEVLQLAGASGTSSGIPGGAAAVAKVQLCLSALGQVLGEPALRVMTQLVMAGVSVEGELLPKFVELLLQGPPVLQLQGASAGGGSTSAQQQQQQQCLSEWRMLRQRQLLSVQEQLAELPHALEALSGVAELTIKAATASAGQLQPPQAAAAAATGATAPVDPPAATGNLMCSIALHTTRASCMALQQQLLLLGCLRHLGSVGTTQLTAADQAAISADLVPQLTTALRSAAVALWLCKTPASSLVAGAVTTSGGIAAAAGAAAGAAGSSGPGPLLGLRLPTPGGTPASTPRRGEGPAAAAAAAAPLAGSLGRSGTAAATPYWHFPLAAHLLPLLWKQQPGQAALAAPGAALHTTGSQLALWLMLGGGAEAVSSAAAGSGGSDWAAGAGFTQLVSAGSGSAAAAYAAVTSPEGLAGRAVLLGYQLFICREYEAMRKLVALVGGNSPSEPGLQFILGLSIACGIKAVRKMAAGAGSGAVTPGGGGSSLPSDNQAAALLGSAVGHLFRAAAGFCGPEAVPLRLVLQLLRQRQSGSGNGTQRGSHAAAAAAAGAAATAMETVDSDKEADGMEGVVEENQPTAGTADVNKMDGTAVPAEAQREAKLRLDFCEAVMLLFEREGVTEGALAFARAALGAVEAAYPPHNQQEKVQQQATLWTSVFNFACELGQNHDAYTAALANPAAERAAEAVRRLVQALLDQGELAQLLALPWAGVLQLKREGLQEPVPVVELVVDKLVRRALHSDLTSSPSPHQVLFDFLTAWGSYKAAAAAMLSYARRLRAHAAASYFQQQQQQQQAGGLTEEIVAAYGACVSMLQLLAASDAWLDPQQPLLAACPAPTPRLFSSSSSSSSQAGAELPVVLSLEEVMREAALFQACVLLQQQLPGLEIMGYDLSADYVMEQLLGGCLFSAALQLAHTMWKDEQLLQQLEALVCAVAGSCAKLQTSQTSAGSDTAAGGREGGSAAGDLEQSVMSFTGPGYLGSAAAAPWEKLRRLLDLYSAAGSGSGSSNHGSSLAAAAVAAAGSSNNHTALASSMGGRLQLAAVDGALSACAGLQLPPWLLQPFRPVAGVAGGMAGCGADPAGLVRVYIRHGRLLDAAQLVHEHLEAWQRQGPLLRAQAAAVWLPVKDLELLHASLVAGAQWAAGSGGAVRAKEAEVLGLWGELLESGVADHLALVRSDSDKLGAGGQPLRGVGGRRSGPMVF